jgi:hypothetical protein
MIARPAERQLGWVDLLLVTVFLIGIYLGFEIRVTAHIPWPAPPTGVAGLLLLWRRRDDINPAHLGAMLIVLLMYLGSVFSADDYNFLSKRFTGLVQLSYSLVLGYALFLTLVRADRSQIAGLMLALCLCMVAGCLLETYGGLRPISDAARAKLFDYGIYNSDLRDMLLYGRIRPKLFTSEPSAVTFSFTVVAFVWLVASRWRWKQLGYVALLAASLLAMPGPTLLLGLVLLAPYQLFLVGRPTATEAGGGRLIRVIGAAIVSLVLLVVAVFAGQSLFAERLHDINSGNDPSFFYRVLGPALTAFDVLQRRPWAGAGLTGEPYIAEQVITVYAQSPEFSTGWEFDKVSDILTNYFWLHWIYLGLIWGLVILAGITLWLTVLRVPSATFCWVVWVVWAILGQASGAYVSPKTWTVLFLAGAVAVLYLQGPRRVSSRRPLWHRVEPTLMRPTPAWR